MTVYGPHCPHDECSWTECDHTGVVEFGCRHQATCPHCGPDSADWPRLVAQWREWAIERYGTAHPAALQARGVPAKVTATAQLVDAHRDLR